MNYWHLQMHQHDQSKFPPSKLREILEKTSLIGMGYKEKNENSLINFKKLDIGDIIAVRDGKTPVALVEVIGNHEYTEDVKEDLDWFPNRRKVKVLDYYKAEYNFKIPKALGTFSICENENAPTSKVIMDWHKRITKEGSMNDYLEILKNNKQIIFTGAPGTGKTYLAKKLAEKIVFPNSGNEEIIDKSIKKYLDQSIDDEKILIIDTAWSYWKSRILSEDFSIDDYANTISNTANPVAIQNGYYITYFLETFSKDIYGSSKPGNAFYYGIKMNDDNKTYTAYNNKDEKIGREQAVLIFDQKIRPWLIEFIKSSKAEMIEMADEKNELIRAGQLLRKMVILENPEEFLYIYQDDTIKRAYSYFKLGNSQSYFNQNKAVAEFLINKYEIKKNKESLRRLTTYIWDYFNSEGFEEYNTTVKDIEKKYLDEHCHFVQFHPSYDYTDFVEGLRPIKKDNQELSFELKNGIFWDICRKAANDKSGSNYVIIIDEINRAEISKVFGELFFAIDPGYRGPEKGTITTQYSNMREEGDWFTNDKKRFYVPDNLYLIGTMNDIDRSVETFDFAMRRRFTWIEIEANDRVSMLEEEILELKDKAVSKMNAINEVINDIDGLNKSYHIGPAYFLKLKDYKNDDTVTKFDKLWRYSIEPLIKEYLRGMPNSKKNHLILKDAYFNN